MYHVGIPREQYVEQGSGQGHRESEYWLVEVL